MKEDPKDQRKEPDPKAKDAALAVKPPVCTCGQDPFVALPPELKPRPAAKKDGLRQVTCPGCGLIYWTNRTTDLCMDCEKKKGMQPPGREG
jgi:hypothetical protein